jgi:hypothetical protein
VSPHLRTETDPVSETLYFLVYRIPDDGKVQKTTNSEYYLHVLCPQYLPYKSRLLFPLNSACVVSSDPRLKGKGRHKPVGFLASCKNGG